MSVTTTTYQVSAEGIGTVPVTVSERGSGPVFVLLHGGAGPQSVTGFADQLADALGARVIVPVHPGFGGTRRPEGLHTVAGLARVYVRLLDELDVGPATIVGNSMGGWIAAEMALTGSPKIGRLLLVDAVGIEVSGHPVVDFFSLSLDQVAEFSYHDPAKFRIDLAAMSPEQQAAMAGNRAALAVYAGTEMADRDLLSRLGQISVPAVVLWGESDQIADADYGRAFAAAIPGASFQLLPATGHVPQIETPAQLITAIGELARV